MTYCLEFHCQFCVTDACCESALVSCVVHMPNVAMTQHADCVYILIMIVAMLQAVCCSDKLHCCPKGSTCDVAAGTCDSNEHFVSWNELAVRDAVKSSSSEDCPGGRQSCPGGDTCCELESGIYGCCPYTHVSISS